MIAIVDNFLSQRLLCIMSSPSKHRRPGRLRTTPVTFDTSASTSATHTSTNRSIHILEDGTRHIVNVEESRKRRRLEPANLVDAFADWNPGEGNTMDVDSYEIEELHTEQEETDEDPTRVGRKVYRSVSRVIHLS